ncbi:MAG: YtxH domain-containing protein [Chlamydiales bacterium]
MARHRSNGKSFFVGTLFGGIVGGVTALLFAPKSGEKLRKDIAKKCHNASEKTHELMEDFCDQTSDLVDKAKEIAVEAKEAASSMLKRKRR